MEKAVQTSVESVRAALTNDYEAKLQAVRSLEYLRMFSDTIAL